MKTGTRSTGCRRSAAWTLCFGVMVNVLPAQLVNDDRVPARVNGEKIRDVGDDSPFLLYSTGLLQILPGMAVPFNATGLWPSANFGDAPKYARGVKDAVFISPSDRETLRGLASRLAELAARPGETEKREQWVAHNALATPRPLVLVDPENG